MKKPDNLVSRATDSFVYGEFSPSSFSESGEIVLVPWNSQEGRRRLCTASQRESFFALAPFLQPQQSPVYCGVASAVAVLNALTLPQGLAPEQSELAIAVPGTEGQHIAFKSFTQAHFLGVATDPIKGRDVVEYRALASDGVYRPGLSLEHLALMIRSHGADAQFAFATETSLETVRETLRRVCSRTEGFAIVHFRADRMGGIARGHISPIGAYDEATDSALVLDVASHKGLWYWAPLKDLHGAMATTYDTQPRGGGLIVASWPTAR